MVIAELCLHSIEAFYLSFCLTQWVGCGAARSWDTNSPKGYSLCKACHALKEREKKKKKVEWAGVSWWFCLSRRLLLIDWWDIVRGGESLPLHHFPSTHFLSLFNCLYLDPLDFSLCLFLFSPLYCWKDQGSEKKIVWVSSWRRLTQHNIIKVFFLVL